MHILLILHAHYNAARHNLESSASSFRDFQL